MKCFLRSLIIAGALTSASCSPSSDEKGDFNKIENLRDLIKRPGVEIEPTKDARKAIENAFGCPVKLPEDSSEEEKLKQDNFFKDYIEGGFGDYYGKKLYTNEELLDQNCRPQGIFLTTHVRLMQYFLRNGKIATFSVAENLGCKHHQTLMEENHLLTQLFSEAGIDIQGKLLNWIEVPNGESGGIARESKKYGGNDEIIMTVESHNSELRSWIEQPAQNSGYNVDPRKEFEATVANELSHEIQSEYFSDLFEGENWEGLSEPFKSFRCEVPGLRFQSNAQAGEFLSDVASWSSEGRYFRFFNPLFYINSDIYGEGKKDNYWYSYEVQKYAMKKVLKEKGVKNASRIVENLIEKFSKAETEEYDQLYIEARKYFTEADFEKIGEIYRRIGVDLLRQMTPYYTG